MKNADGDKDLPQIKNQIASKERHPTEGPIEGGSRAPTIINRNNQQIQY